jgi:hypothetical protein
MADENKLWYAQASAHYGSSNRDHGFHRCHSFSNPEPLSSITLLEVVSSGRLLVLGVHAALRVEELSLDNVFRSMLPDTATALPQHALVDHSLISDSLIRLSSRLASLWLA